MAVALQQAGRHNRRMVIVALIAALAAASIYSATLLLDRGDTDTARPPTVERRSIEHDPLYVRFGKKRGADLTHEPLYIRFRPAPPTTIAAD